MFWKLTGIAIVVLLVIGTALNLYEEFVTEDSSGAGRTYSTPRTPLSGNTDGFPCRSNWQSYCVRVVPNGGASFEVPVEDADFYAELYGEDAVDW